LFLEVPVIRLILVSRLSLLSLLLLLLLLLLLYNVGVRVQLPAKVLNLVLRKSKRPQAIKSSRLLLLLRWIPSLDTRYEYTFFDIRTLKDTNIYPCFGGRSW
jgi:hypothetical protein